jgi:23S rRNA (pseudouridine1915-N3)-methyltransferase
LPRSAADAVRLRVVTLGHRMPAWVDAGVADYVKRLPRELGFEFVELKPAARDRGRTVEQLLDDEAARLAAACGGTTVVALDERGTPWTTREVAARLARWRDEAASVSFVIGSADGLAPAFKQSASALVSLSALTLPHALVRILLVEQLYRAASLNAGHPYHRD